MKQFYLSTALVVGVLVGQNNRVGAALSVTGVTVEQLSWVDRAMTNWMASNEITGGIIGIMRNGVIIFQHGYGWKDQARTIAMPENALVRLASCTKPITAAAIRKLVATTEDLSLDTPVFDLGQTPTGILKIAPFPSQGDERLTNVTIQLCLSHRGGWNRNEEADYAQRPCETAEELGIESPPGVDNTIAWALGKKLHYEPDSDKTNEYSNFGYMVLGKIIETVSGMDVVEYHRKHVLTPRMWVPRTDLVLGRTFAERQPLREAWYDAGQGTCVFRRSILSPCTELNRVDKPYGTWDHESYVGFGGLVASAATMLELAERYYLQNRNPDIGIPLTERVNGNHGGKISGTSTLVRQREDGVNVFLFFNKYVEGATAYVFSDEELQDQLDAQTDWPTTPIGGFWVDPDRTTRGEYGSYDRPFAGLDEALDYLADGSRVNFRPGSSHWTGTISTRLELRAPNGPVTIGKVTP